MKYIDEYRDKKLVLDIIVRLKKISKKEIRLMEVCGGHTAAIHKFGIPSLLPGNIKLLSGPGCPVCVTDKKFIDRAIAYSRLDNVIIATFGDLLRVPGSYSTLDLEKASGKNVTIVYSSLEALEIAKANSDKKIIFLGIGFETTAPTSAAIIVKAKEENIRNFFILSSHKIMPPAMKAIVDEGVKINGYICPGHVSVITGTGIYKEIAEKYRLGCVVCGFEPVDIMETILMLVKQIESDNPKIEIEYKRAVKPEGNIKAKNIMKKVFDLRDDWWRGFGIIKQSGYFLNSEYEGFDAEKNFNVEIPETVEDKGCICAEVLKGIKSPPDCMLFGKVCTPENPVGACMVSSEGACQAFYKYR